MISALTRDKITAWDTMHSVVGVGPDCMHIWVFGRALLVLLFATVPGTRYVPGVCTITVASTNLYFCSFHQLFATAVRVIRSLPFRVLPGVQQQYPPRKSSRGHTQPLARSIESSHASCKDEFRRNPRSRSSYEYVRIIRGAFYSD